MLVDLSGHTQGIVCPCLRKPAPVALSWLGYSGTTGLDTMDYLVADDRVVRGDEQFLSERPCGCRMAISASRRRNAGLARGAGGRRPFTFGSFNSHNKLSPETLAAWAAILKGVPGSRLLLKSRGLARCGDRRRDHGCLCPPWH